MIIETILRIMRKAFKYSRMFSNVLFLFTVICVFCQPGCIFIFYFSFDVKRNTAYDILL